MWGKDIAISAAYLRRWASRTQAPEASDQRKATSPIAKSMRQARSYAETDLTARAFRLNNRNREAANRYLKKHKALAAALGKGSCSDGS